MRVLIWKLSVSEPVLAPPICRKGHVLSWKREKLFSVGINTGLQTGFCVMQSESIFDSALHFDGEQKALSCTLKILSFMRIPFLRTIISTVCLSAVTLQAGAQQKWVRYRAPEFAERPGWSLGLNFGMSDLWADVGTKSVVDHYTND